MSHIATAPPTPSVPDAPRRPGLTLTVLSIACVAYVLQQTLVVPALPIFQEDLNTSATWAAWVFTGFLLTSAVATTPLGKLGDTYGKRRLLAISLGDLRRRHRGRRAVHHDRHAHRLARAAGRRRRHLPAVLRHHSRRVPARARRGGPRPALGDVRDRRGRGPGALRSDPPGAELALALLVRRHPGGHRPGDGVEADPRVARAHALALRRLGRPHPVDRPVRAPARPERGRPLGLAQRPDARRVRPGLRGPGPLGLGRDQGAGPHDGHARHAPAGRLLDQRAGPGGRLLDVRHLPAHADPGAARARPAGGPRGARSTTASRAA